MRSILKTSNGNVAPAATSKKSSKKTTKQQPPPPPHFVRRTVRFNEDALESVVVPAELVLTDDIYQELWYHKPDYSRFKLEHRAVACRLAHATFYEDFVNEMFEHALETGEEEDETFLEECAKAGCKLNDAGMGLEALAVEGLLEEQQDRREEILDSILRIEKMVRDEGLDGDVSEEMIRHVSEQISKPLRIFAHELGVMEEIMARQD